MDGWSAGGGEQIVNCSCERPANLSLSFMARHSSKLLFERVGNRTLCCPNKIAAVDNAGNCVISTHFMHYISICQAACC